jgi:hypothetical protein
LLKVQRFYVPIPVVVLVVAAFVACGRTGLDAPFGAGGAGGAAGNTTGVAGLSVAGHGGSGGLATGGFAIAGAGGGSFAGAGGGSFAGAGGGSFGGAGGGSFAGAGGGSFGGAGGGLVNGCVDGTNDCADAATAEFCVGGSFTKVSCALGCLGGDCIECMPGTSTCLSDGTVQTCSATGIRQPPQLCGSTCVNGACVDCIDGDTRCTSATTEQTCKAGQWTPDEECPFVCAGNACGMSRRHVFVTSQAFVGGSLGGLTGADDACRTLATAAGLASSWAAWLSDDTTSPATRFPQDVGPYVLVDGTIVADNWADLTSGTLRHPIDLTETGTTPAFVATAPCSGKFPVWTNTRPNGSEFTQGFDCGDWSDPMGLNVALGDSGFSDFGSWTQSCSSFRAVPLICTDTAGLYCFEQ